MADRDESMPDFAALFAQLFGPDVELPPELAQMMAALQQDPASSPMAAMMHQQMQALFGSSDPNARVATATDLARKVVAQVGADASITEHQRREASEAVAVASLWLDPVTTLEVPDAQGQAWSRAEWVEATMPAWFRLVEPVAEGVTGAAKSAMKAQLDRLAEGTENLDLRALGLPESLLAQLGGADTPLSALLGQVTPAMEQMSSGMFAAQLGQGVGALAADVVSGTEVGLPVTDPGIVALMPAQVAQVAADLGIDEAQVRLYLAVREAARVRLFTGVPWLGPQIEAAVRDYGRHVTIDVSAIEAAIGSVDMSDPAALNEAMSQAQLFAATPTPQQQSALDRLGATLALVEGWVDLVTAAAVAPHLPQAAALGEAARRRRVGGPAQKAFAGFVGLDVEPRRLRDATNLWAALFDRGGMPLRDASWDHPDLAPTADDLDDPLGYVDRRAAPPQPDAMDLELDRLLSEADGDA
ncbi:MAG: zinc-dependent metalloprotease [Dermatophilaceae bacterium]|nr:zinc-dependent metalloprotease [Actinomycetales bacterium]MBP8881067.1 zinc-dependent metalloprotease [Dermatophilaceae bacterium]MBP9918873.1 zinc-dependent metalloprotease [Dermatophilaceae bacterium]